MVAGALLVVLGIWTFIPLYVALVIGAGIFFGIKYFVSSRQKLIEKSVGEGICVECGEKIQDNKCPNCDSESSV